MWVAQIANPSSSVTPPLSALTGRSSLRSLESHTVVWRLGTSSASCPSLSDDVSLLVR